MKKQTQGLALLPFLVCQALAYAETEQAEAGKVQLDTVVVKAKSAKSFSIASDGDLQDRVNLGLLGRANAFTVPITVVNYDEKMLENNAARTLVDAVAQRDASVMQFGGESNTLQGLYIRGFQLDARQFSVNGLSGMYAYQSSPTAAVGSAQLIKGASTAIGGMDPEGAVSGAVNIETKKAADEGSRKIGIGYFSNSRAQATFDLGWRFGNAKEWGIRTNGTFRHGDTARKNYQEDNKEFALNTDYRGEKLRVALDLMQAERKTTGARARFQDLQNLQFSLPKAPDGTTNLVPGWQAQTTQDRTAMLTFGYDTDWPVQFSGGIGYSRSNYQGNFAQLTALNEAGDYYVGTARNGSRLSDQTSKTFSMNLTARGELETGDVSHNWSAAYDRVRRSRLNYWGSGYSNSIATNIYNPYGNRAFGDTAPVLAGLNALPDVHSTYTANSVAFSDTLGFADNRYRLTLGGRMQWIGQEDKPRRTNNAYQKASAHRFSPMLAAAWVPGNDWVVYGNYMEDLEPGAIDSESGTMAKPRVSRQMEVGVRKNWGNVVTALNAFQISRPGYWRGNSTSGTDFVRMNAIAGEEQGKERNRGIEFNTYANLLNQTLRPSFGLTYMKADLIDYPTYADNLVNGSQVASPRVIAKAGVEWDSPFADGLTLNGNVQYYGKSYQDTQRQYKLPGYMLVDVGARYTTMWAGNKLVVSGAVENLFNKNYWQVQRGQYDRSFAVLGLPRTYWLKASLEF
ncbi:ligand-gated channel protein [Neisseria arctica]|uniref:Ligand-gated channel protein n=1 Tax=Neisseria arctica TaxID=1470200 RepID=A0A0J1C1N2_9NEIS|nr:TonB-dependent siderophore receptor [Neisseria arctica]KLT72188.1 ligand-gated channel protein [Neisseria arctica]UOO87291.1 TonB-dependent siderophore receptor [Neisseria arctica]